MLIKDILLIYRQGQRFYFYSRRQNIQMQQGYCLYSSTSTVKNYMDAKTKHKKIVFNKLLSDVSSY